MITRTWRGWTTLQNAPLYQQLLLTEIFPGIERRGVAGYRGISLLRRDIGDEVEFSMVMWFDSIEAVKVFAGEKHEVAVVPPKARAVLSRYEHVAMHYETVVAPPFLRP